MKKTISILLTLTLVLAMLIPATTWGATAKYNKSDVAAINNIIANNGLKATKDKPATWKFARWSGGRVISLDLPDKSLKGTLDLSKLTILQSLDCSSNDLTAVNVTKNTQLQYLRCNDNWLKTLNVTKNINLQTLMCHKNDLTSINVTKNLKLQTLWCDDNRIKTLNITKNTRLEDLRCTNNQLKALDVTKNTRLEIFHCGFNELTKLDVRKCVRLAYFSFSHTQITQINLTKNTQLEYLVFYNGKLKALDISKNKKLKYLDAYDNQLTVLNLTGFTKFNYLWFSWNPLKTLVCPDGSKLTVASAVGGTHVVHNDSQVSFNKKEVTLYAQADSGYSFDHWEFDKSVKILNGNVNTQQIKIVIPKDGVTATPVFVQNS